MSATDKKQEAIEIMIGWLSHENELGKAPAKIEVAGEFDYDDEHYYILKFKEGIFSKWEVGVCGIESGHTFSEFEKYDEKTAKDKCIEMIEYLKEYWKGRFYAELERRGVTEEEYENMTEEEWQAKGEEADKKEKEDGGQNLGFILLENTNFDLKKVLPELKKEWGIEIDDYELDENSLAFHIDNTLVALSLMEAPVPNGEAEYFAGANYIWKEAVETTKKHQAHLMVIAIDQDGDTLEAMANFTVVTSCCLNQDSVLGIYTTGTVHQPEYYSKVANLLKDGEMPIPLWVYVGLVQGENGNCAYTYGLNAFGKMDMEIIDSEHSMDEILSFFYYVIQYIIKSNMIFRDGETISFNSELKLQITKSDAVYLDGESLKIGF